MGTTNRSLLAEMATAFVRAIPTTLPADGVLSPRSVVWRVHSDLSRPVAGIRSLLLQALHPLAMAGVHQHSAWQTDPLGRLSATAAYVDVLTFGDRSTAEAFARRVRAVHERVRGVDPESDSAYSATDPRLLLWVHDAMVDSSLAAAAAFGTPLSAVEADDYCNDMVEFACLVGIPREMVPANRERLNEAIASELPALRYSGAAQESIPHDDMAATWNDICTAAVATLPAWALRLYGWTPHPLTPDYRTEVRQVLGTLDFALELEPGVVEARQRILGWMRGVRA
jgi:uncharacterized protein (DUF2236 family)